VKKEKGDVITSKMKIQLIELYFEEYESLYTIRILIEERIIWMSKTLNEFKNVVVFEEKEGAKEDFERFVDFIEKNGLSLEFTFNSYAFLENDEDIKDYLVVESYNCLLGD